MAHEKIIDLKLGLKKWIEKHTFIPEFAKRTGYSYQHAWSLIRSKAPITDSVIGRFVSTYGVDALAEWFSLSSQNDF